MMKSVSVLVIATILLAATVPYGEAVISCNRVYSYMNPCIPYITGNQQRIGRCCNGVRDLYNALRSPYDRRSACICLKSFAGSYSSGGGGTYKVSGIPRQCGVYFPFQINPYTDCSRVH